MNTYLYTVSFILLMLFISPTVVAQIPDSLNPEMYVAGPAHREVKLKDPNTGHRFWLGYADNKELLELRKAGFIILKTRRVRNSSTLRPWESILKHFFIEVSKEGIRTLAPKQSP